MQLICKCPRGTASFILGVLVEENVDGKGQQLITKLPLKAKFSNEFAIIDAPFKDGVDEKSR